MEQDDQDDQRHLDVYGLEHEGSGYISLRHLSIPRYAAWLQRLTPVAEEARQDTPVPSGEPAADIPLQPASPTPNRLSLGSQLLDSTPGGQREDAFLDAAMNLTPNIRRERDSGTSQESSQRERGSFGSSYAADVSSGASSECSEISDASEGANDEKKNEQRKNIQKRGKKSKKKQHRREETKPRSRSRSTSPT
jgi:hypothetical protein